MDLGGCIGINDIEIGAILLLHLSTFCENCKATRSPQWRRGWYSDDIKKAVPLCNACGIKYSKGQFCPYCNEIYGKEHASEGWLSCITCGRSVHTKCETEHNEGKSGYFRYKCPSCRFGCRYG